MRVGIGALGIFIVFGLFALTLSVFTPLGDSADYATGSTTMNVTVRGWVSILISNCLTNGITFATQDQSSNGNNASCNNNAANGGSTFNLTVDASSTVSINFSHASNRTNLTTESYYIGIGNVTYHANSTANNGTNIFSNGTAISLTNGWSGMETCESSSINSNCWATYFLSVPAGQQPGVYVTGYCWCGRQEGTSESNCGTCA
jgi:hypothetical protein